MIRFAKEDDFEHIRAIRKRLGLQRERLGDAHYREQVEREGFLLYPDITHAEFLKDLEKDFLVYEDKGQVRGYARIESTQEMSKGNQITWEKPEMEEKYYRMPHADIGVIVVNPSFAHKGIATQLLQAVIEQVKNEVPYLFSLVVYSPVKNIPSLHFHEKNGFERIAITHYDRLFELDYYESILFAKKLTP